MPLTIGLLSLAGCRPSDSVLNHSAAANLTEVSANAASSFGGPINPNGEAEKVSLAKTGDSSEYRFTGLAGQSISVATSGSFADNCSVKLSLVDADGYPIGEPACAGHSASLPETVLKADGIYKLQLSSAAAESGTLSLSLSSARGPQSITPGAAALAVAPAPGQTLRLGFVGTPDWRVAIRSLRKLLGSGAAGDACAYVVRLVGPDGSILAESSCAADSAALAAKAVKIGGGVYQLEIQNIGSLGGSTAPVPVQLFQFRDQTGVMSLGAAGARDGLSAKAALEQPGQRSLMTFSGRAGERYRVLASESKITTAAASALPSDYAGDACDETRLSVLRPDGSVLTSNRYCGGAGFIKPFMLDQGGNWTLMAESTNGGTGSAKLSMMPVDDGTGTDTVLGSIPTDGSPVTATISGAGDSADFTFTGIAGRRFSLLPTNASFPNSSNYIRLFLVRPDGSVRNSVDCYDGACLLDPFDGSTSSATALDVSGTWTVSMHALFENSTGSAQLQLYAVTDQTGGVASDGTAVTSMVTIPGQRSIFTFTGTAGQRYSALTSASTVVNAHNVYFRKPDGSLVYVFQGYNAGSTRIGGELTLDQTGDWAVVLDPFGRSTGDTSLQLYQLTDQTGSIAPNGAATTVNIATPGQNVAMAFTGTAGQRASLAISNVTFDCAPFNNIYDIRLLRPDGSAFNTSQQYLCGENYLDFGVLDQSGTFTLVFDPRGVAVGSASLQFYAATDQTGPVSGNGTAVTSTITTPGQNSRFSFSGTAGQRYSTLLSNSNLSLTKYGRLYFLRPDGSRVNESGYYNSGLFRDAYTLDETGTWTVVVDPDKQNIGNASLQLYLVADQTSTIATNGTAATANVTTPGQNSRLTFSGTAGQRYSVLVSDSTLSNTSAGYIASMAFVRPDGSTLNFPSNFYDPSVFKEAVTLDQSGTWTVLLNPGDRAIGTASVQLYLLSDQTSAIPTNGTAVTSTISMPGQRSRFTFTGTAGQRLSALLDNSNLGPSIFGDIYFLKPDGSRINEAVYFNPGIFRDVYTLDQTGTWSVVVDPRDRAIGTASLRLNLITDQTAAINAGGAAVASTITMPGQRSLLTFGGAVGDSVTVTVRDAVFSSALGSGALNLMRPDGSTQVFGSYNHTGSGAQSGILDSIILDQTGSWSVVLDPSAEQAATASVRLVRNATNRPTTTMPERAAVGPINPNGTAVLVSVTTADQRADYSFTGSAGQRFGVLVSNPSFTGGGGSISLRRPDGQLIPLSSQYSGGAFNASTAFFQPYTLDQSGIWRVTLQPFRTGSASLSLIAVNDQIGTIATNGVAVTSMITTRGQASRFTFTGTPGQLQSLQASNTTSCEVYCDIIILRPDGSILASTNVSNGQVGFIDQFRIDQTGTYTVLLDPYESGTGTATLRLFTATDQASAINSNGTAVNINITAPGQNGSYTFTGTVGQRYSVQVTNSNFGLYGAVLALRSPDGRLIASQNIYDDATGAYIDRFTLDQSGDWSVVFDPQQDLIGTGSLQLFLNTDQTGTTNSGGTVNASVTAPGQQAVFSFNGTVGQRYTTKISNSTFGSSGAVVSLQRPDGTTTTQVGFSDGTALLEPFTLDQAGSWKLVLDPYDNGTGSATLQLQLITDQTLPIATNGTAVTATITTPGQRSLFTFTGSIGQHYSLRISNSTVAPNFPLATVQFRRPDGSFVDEQGFFDPGVYVDAETFMLDQAGSWTLVLDPGGAYTGSATVQLYLAADATGASASDGTPFDTTILVPGQRGRYRFAAAAGQRYDLQFTGSTFNNYGDPNDTSGCAAVYSLLRPDNSVYSAPGFVISNNTCQPGSAYRNVALDTDGTWTVLLNPNGQSTGSAQLSLTLKGSPVPTYWADFTSATPGTPGSAAGTIGAPISVSFTYSGEVGDQSNIVGGFTPWTPANTYSGGTIQDPPLIQDGIALLGGSTAGNTVTFSKPVRNPVLAIAGLGYNGVANLASYQFSGQPFTVQSGGPSNFGGQSILSSGSSVIGTVGNGTVQFNGMFSSISWTNPTASVNFGSSGFTVGIPLQPPPVPTGTTAIPASTQVTVAWTAAQTAATYNVYRSTTANDPSPVLAASGITGTSTVITGLTNDVPFYFSVAGVNAGGIGARSTEASAAPGPSIRINDVTLTEGNSGTTTATFTVTLSRAAASMVTVAYDTANGTATAGSDYVAASGTLSFTAGQLTKMVAVTVNGDLLVEPNETFFVNLSAATAATIADVQGQGTVTNDDSATSTPSLTINDVSIAEGNTGTKNLVFTVSLSPAATGTVAVTAITANGTATSGSDYTGGSATLSFAAGQTSKTVSLPIKGDTTVEPDQTFFVNLSNPTGGAVIGDAQGIGTILNDDGVVTPSLSISDVSVTEGNAGAVNAAFTVSLSAAASGPVTVAYTTADGTATAGSDYVAGSGTLSFAAGTTTQTVNVLVNGDTVVEPNETFVVNLSAPSGATLADAQGQATISNDDTAAATPTLTITDVSITEGNTGTKNLVFTVSLMPAATGAVTVSAATANGTATSGSDYTGGTLSVSFSAGQTAKTISLPVKGDTTVESDETFFVNLSNATGGAVIGDAQGIGTILNDDGAVTPSLRINDISVTEGNSGTKNLTFTVSLSPAATGAVSVAYATADGTAAAGSDYLVGGGTLNFPAGTTTQTVNVVINGDTAVEPNETLFVNLSSATGATIADAQGQGTITNDDAAATPTLTINDVSTTEGNSGTKNLTFTVSLSPAATGTVAVTATTANGTATSGSDYTGGTLSVRFTAGQTSKTISLPVKGDTTVEPDETFFVNLTNPTGGAVIGDAQGLGTILNDD